MLFSSRFISLFTPFFSLAILCLLINCSPRQEDKKATKVVEPLPAPALSITEQMDVQISDLLRDKEEFQTRHSLMYGAGDYVFDAVQYEKEGQLMIVEENGTFAENGYIKRRIILDEGGMVFVREERKLRNPDFDDFEFEENRYYFQKGQFFKALSRKARDVRFLSSGEFTEINPGSTDFSEDLQRAVNAIHVREEFELTFQELLEVADQTYVLLGDTFTTSLLVLKEDETIAAIRKNPSDYLGKVLEVEWEFRIIEGTKEAIYKRAELKE